MRSNLYLIITLLFFVSCEAYDIEEIKNESTQVKAGADYDINLIGQLDGIPLNIKLVSGEMKDGHRFLNVDKSGDVVNVYKMDDGSLRQRWNIKLERFDINTRTMRYKLSILGGNKTFKDGIIHTKDKNGDVLPYLIEYSSYPTEFRDLIIEEKPNTSYCYI